MSILRSGVARTTFAAAAVTTLTATLLTAGGPGTATAAPDCYQIPGTDPFYDPPSASVTYDTLFTFSHPVPGLDEYVPQGTATWSNWQGDDDLILITAYHEDETDEAGARVYAIDARTGQPVGSVELQVDGKNAYSHVGGIAVFEQQGWAYISADPDRKNTVRKYSLSKLKEELKEEGSGEIDPEGEQTLRATSFLTSHAPSNTLWAGEFTITDPDSSFMYSYTVADNGDLKLRPGRWEVPRKTQGLVVTRDLFIYSASYDRDVPSTIYAVRRGEGSSDLDTARLTCFPAPSMSEGLTVYGNQVHLAYESGASRYADSNHEPLNIISNLHKTPLSWLEERVPR